ncbi:hypothetical protein WJX81_006277 [Elliptochloris bilobata]|uniref:AP2/ERF domain-containing protein n=1 Tax=Elliptochloris bilobata TaxID=381761 RepID=A0AAW1QIQ2_9CHLO
MEANELEAAKAISKFLVKTDSDKELPAPLTANERAELQGLSLEQLLAPWKAPFSRGSSAFRGVGWHKRVGKWTAQIRRNGKNMALGAFKTEIEAAQAYDHAVIERDGRGGKLNFPVEDYLDDRAGAGAASAGSGMPPQRADMDAAEGTVLEAGGPAAAEAGPGEHIAAQGAADSDWDRGDDGSSLGSFWHSDSEDSLSDGTGFPSFDELHPDLLEALSLWRANPEAEPNPRMLGNRAALAQWQDITSRSWQHAAQSSADMAAAMQASGLINRLAPQHTATALPASAAERSRWTKVHGPNGATWVAGFKERCEALLERSERAAAQRQQHRQVVRRAALSSAEE